MMLCLIEVGPAWRRHLEVVVAIVAAVGGGTALVDVDGVHVCAGGHPRLRILVGVDVHRLHRRHLFQMGEIVLAQRDPGDAHIGVAEVCPGLSAGTVAGVVNGRSISRPGSGVDWTGDDASALGHLAVSISTSHF